METQLTLSMLQQRPCTVQVRLGVGTGETVLDCPGLFETGEDCMSTRGSRLTDGRIGFVEHCGRLGRTQWPTHSEEATLERFGLHAHA